MPEMGFDQSGESRFKILIWEDEKHIGTLQGRDVIGARSQFGSAASHRKLSFPTNHQRARRFEGTMKNIVVTFCLIFSSTACASAQETACNASLSNYNSIKSGMSYENVKRIIGCDGSQLSSSEMAGFKTEMYMWSGDSAGGNMNAMFQNNKVISKSQFGLK
jgi:hypothetical protein